MIKPNQQSMVFNIKDKRLEKSKTYDLDREISLSEELADSIDNGFCHHCKQLRSTYILASCNYSSETAPQMMPVRYTINGFHLPNVDLRQTQLINSLMAKKILNKNKNKELQYHKCSK